MAIKKHLVLSMRCDDCLNTLDDNTGRLITTEDRDELVEAATELGWLLTIVDEFCPDCAPDHQPTPVSPEER